MGSNIPALTLHMPHNAPLYVTMLSKQQRRIAPEIHIRMKYETGKGDNRHERPSSNRMIVIIVKISQKIKIIGNIPFQQQM